MLEGLEISIVKFSQLSLRNDRFRIDAEFSKKEYLNIEKELEKRKFVRLIETNSEIIHPSEIKREYVETGTWFFRAQNLRSLKIENSNDVYISIDDAIKLTKNEILIGDILITRTGANYGQTAIYNREVKAIGSSHVLILRNSYLNQSFIAVFFNTSFGRKMIDKGMYGGAQPEIAPYYLLNIPIPIFSKDFQINIENLLNESTKKEQESNKTYKQTETLLLETLGLKDFQPSKEKVNVKSFKDSFLSSGRLDAEYYQMKYEDYLLLIEDYKNGFGKLGELCNLNNINFKPDEKITFKYIELSNIGKSGEITGCTNAVSQELPSRARRLVREKDVVISSIEGSLDSCALITKEYDNSICSTGFFVINSKKINSESLLVLFKSKPMQNILKRNCSGTILTAINKDEFLNIPIPIIEDNIQQQISIKIEESFRLKKQSEELLDLAKTAVEMAIEEGDEKAMRFINKNLNLING